MSQAPSSPQTTNKTAQRIDFVIKYAAYPIILTAENLIIAELPFLGAPVIKQIWEWLFSWIADYYIKAAETGATFAVIDHQVEGEEQNLSKEEIALIAAQKSGDANAIKKAIQDYANVNSALIHYDGSASAQ